MGKLLEKTGLILTDAVGVITYADDAASRLFAHSPERLRGTQLAELFPELGDNAGSGDSGRRNEPPAIGASGTPRYLVGAGSDGCGVPLVVTMLEAPESEDAGFIVTVMPRPNLPADAEYGEAVAMSAAIVQATLDALVLMELRMPVMDGHEATRRIRALDTPHSKTPIVAMTTGVVREELEAFLKAGADAYITKPVAKSDLLRMVSNWFETQGQTDSAELFQGEDAELVDRRALTRLEQDTSPDALPAMLEIFLKETRQRLDVVTEMLADGDLKGIGEQAHAMKSSAGTFGAHRLHLLAEAVESACRENERGRALALARKLPQVARSSIRALEPFLRSAETPFQPGSNRR
jgi:CheY-like chemotaxis protein